MKDLNCFKTCWSNDLHDTSMLICCKMCGHVFGSISSIVIKGWWRLPKHNFPLMTSSVTLSVKIPKCLHSNKIDADEKWCSENKYYERTWQLRYRTAETRHFLRYPNVRSTLDWRHSDMPPERQHSPCDSIYPTEILNHSTEYVLNLLQLISVQVLFPNR